MSPRNTLSPSHPRLDRFRNGLRSSERFGLGLLAVVSSAVALLLLISAVFSIAALFDPRGAAIELVAEFDVPSSTVTGSVELVSGSFTQADLVVAGLEPWSLVILAAGRAVTALMVVGIAVMIASLCVSLLRGRPFSRSSTWMISTVSAVLIAGSLIAIGLTTIANFWIASQLNEDPIGTTFPLASIGSLVPLFVGIALAAIGAAFEIGARLQRDTEGLV